MKFVRPVINKQTEDLRQEYESFGGVIDGGTVVELTEAEKKLPLPEEVRNLTTVILKVRINGEQQKHLYKMVEGNWILVSTLTTPENPVNPQAPIQVTEEHRGQAIYVQQEEPTDQQTGDLWFRF